LCSIEELIAFVVFYFRMFLLMF